MIDLERAGIQAADITRCYIAGEQRRRPRAQANDSRRRLPSL
jgi:hypothetical protein